MCVSSYFLWHEILSVVQNTFYNSTEAVTEELRTRPIATRNSWLTHSTCSFHQINSTQSDIISEIRLYVQLINPFISNFIT